MQEATLTLQEHLRQEWGWIAVRGVLALLFGILAILWPLGTIAALALLWGAFALADGVSALIVGWKLHKKGARWWPYAIFGVIGILAGIFSLLWPAITAVVLIYFIAAWAVFGGISLVAAAIRLRKEIEGEWLLALAGIFSTLFGLLIFIRPLPEGVLAIAWIVGFYAMVTGILYIMLAIRVRRKY